MICSFCNKEMDLDETGILCFPCELGGHARCYAQRGHGNHNPVGRNTREGVSLVDAMRRAAHHQRLSGRLNERET